MGWARFTIVCDECVRIEYAPAAGGFVDAPSLTAVSRPGTPLVVEDADGAEPVVLRTPRFVLEFRPRGCGFTRDTLRVQIVGPFAPGGPQGASVEWHPGARQQGNLGGTLATLDGLKRSVPLPDGLLSRDGWFLIDDSRGHVLDGGWVKTRDEVVPGGGTDWFLLCYGADYAGALRAFTRFAGAVPMPRRSLLGSWYSRYWPHTSEQYRAIVNEYESHGIPLDVVVLDMDWHRDGWTGWSWNRDLLPDAEELLRWMRERGLAVTLNLHPADGVGPHEDRYAEFMRAIGRDPASRETVPFDAGDRRYMGSLFEQVHRPLEESGVDFWWVDWQQGRSVPSVPGLTNLAWLNCLYFRHTAGEGARGRRGVSFSRWAGESHAHEGHAGQAKSSSPPLPSGRGGQDAFAEVWSDHRHPIHFSGDAHTGWEMLDFQVPFTIVAGNAGCFYWSHDIGGHFGPRDEEATARWVQFGALSAALRLHSARTEALDRRPWSYAPRFLESMRRAFALRATLMPYLYTQVRACHERSLPLLRAMYVDRPMETESYRSARQFMLGEHLLCAPITAPGVGPSCVAWREVWFPSLGLEGGGVGAWYRWGKGERYAAGTHAVVSASIDETAMFAPGGVAIPLRAGVGPRMTDGDHHELVVRTWPGTPGQVSESELYEDDGETRGHEFGEFARTPMRLEWLEGAEADRVIARLTFGPTRGRYSGQPPEREWCVEFAGISGLCLRSAPDGTVMRDGAKHEGVVALRIPAAPMDRQIRLEVEVMPADARQASDVHGASRRKAAFGDGVAPDAAGARRSIVVGIEADRAAIELGVGVVAITARPDLGELPAAVRVIDTRGVIDSARAEMHVIDVAGRSSVERWRGEVALAGSAGPGRWAEITLPDAPLKGAALGLRATRLVRVGFSIDGRAMSISREVQKVLGPLREWRVIGPFDWHWARSIAEQHAGPERGGLGERDRHVGAGGAILEWHDASGGPRWATDLAATMREFGGQEHGLGYAVTVVVSSRKQPARLHLESSDKVEAWVNGHKVYSLDAFESHAAVDGGADIALRTGRNTLLVKCASGGVAGLGGWGFTAAIESEFGAGVEARRHSAAAHPAAG